MSSPRFATRRSFRFCNAFVGVDGFADALATGPCGTGGGGPLDTGDVGGGGGPGDAGDVGSGGDF